MEMNKAQQRAIAAEGDLIGIVAGPGSGKTATTVQRIIRDQNENLADHQIAVTFTNNAGNELARRIEQAGGSKMHHCGTLHAFALRMLREHRTEYREMAIVGDREYEKQIRAASKAIGHKATMPTAKAAAMSSHGSAGNQRTLGLAIKQQMRRSRMIHPDLILGWFLQELPAMRQFPQGATIYVDECQDTSRIDGEIYEKMIGHHKCRMFFVGDPRQSIYGFRGADPTVMKRFLQRADETVELPVNYRSGPAICALASRITEKAFPDFEPTVPHQNTDDMITFQPFAAAEDEAIRIASWLENAGPGTAVLTRYNQSVQLIASVARSRGIEIETSIDTEPDETEKQWRDAMVRLVASQPQQLTEDEWAQDLLKAGIPIRIANQTAEQLAETEQLEARISLVSARERKPGKTDLPYVGTIHSAKGSEWDAVWIASADHRAIDTRKAADLCLLFVAITRARRELVISFAKSRQQHCREIGLQWAEALR